MKNIRNFLIFNLIVLLFTACDADFVAEEVTDIACEKWNKDEVATCEFEIEDADSYYTLMLDLRNTVDYSYQNLYLFCDIKTPDTLYRDTLEVFLADPAGNWYGNGNRLKDRSYYFAADPKFVSTTHKIKGHVPYSVATFSGLGKHPFRFEPLIVPFRVEVDGQQAEATECYPVKVKFPKAGKYKFTFWQAMREENLEGISSIGLTVKKYNESALIKAIQKENKARLKRAEELNN